MRLRLRDENIYARPHLKDENLYTLVLAMHLGNIICFIYFRSVIRFYSDKENKTGSIIRVHTMQTMKIKQAQS